MEVAHCATSILIRKILGEKNERMRSIRVICSPDCSTQQTNLLPIWWAVAMVEANGWDDGDGVSPVLSWKPKANHRHGDNGKDQEENEPNPTEEPRDFYDQFHPPRVKLAAMVVATGAVRKRK